MRTCRHVIALVALLALSAVLPAQTPSKIAGVWTVHSVRVFKNLQTGDTTTVAETAQMVLQPRGDSVFGYWQSPSSANDSEATPRTVRGVLLRDGARVQVERDGQDDAGFFATVGREIVEWLKTHVHNAPTTIPLLEFTVRNDSLIGTRRTLVPADGSMGPPRPFHAVRAK